MQCRCKTNQIQAESRVDVSNYLKIERYDVDLHRDEEEEINREGEACNSFPRFNTIMSRLSVTAPDSHVSNQINQGL